MNMSDTAKFAAFTMPTAAKIRGELRQNEPMARHVSWRAGGSAKQFFKPADLADLQGFLPTLPNDEPVMFVGLGSNLLVRDGGFKGTVVLTTPMLHGLHLDAADASVVRAGAGVASPHLAKFAAKHSLAAAEWLAGVPGTVGGALAMNAGCYGTEAWDQVVDCTTIDRHGALHTRTSADYEIGYRHVQTKVPPQPCFYKWGGDGVVCRGALSFPAGRCNDRAGAHQGAPCQAHGVATARQAQRGLDVPQSAGRFRSAAG